MEDIFKNESKDFNEGYNKGYASGRKFYVNDIKLELGDVNTTIECLEKYSPESLDLISELKGTHKVLMVILKKAESKKHLE